MADASAFRIWPPVAFGVPFLAGLAASTWLADPVELPGWSRDAGALLLVAAAAWQAWGLWSLLRRKTGLLPGQATTTLVTTGPFRVSRNPLYVGFAALHLGAALAFGSLWALVALPAAILAVLWGAILPEEAYLAKRFGAEYADYRNKVRRWL